MNDPERRWRRVEALYHEALARPASGRAAALAEACGDDQALLNDIESLLNQPDSANHLLNRSATAWAAHLVSGTRLLRSGQRIGAFEVQDLLGMGGMGEVYRARDTKLDREVAIKVLPDYFAADPAKVARFNREARILASLNHPNIAVIHGIEEVTTGNGEAGPRALIMELVDGEDLLTRIASGPIPLAEAVPIARQIVKALEAAHEHGVIHRDLKPANIRVRRDGVVKVFDFGLAKIQAPSLPPEHSAAATLTQSGEQRIMGTPGYMSPEQIRGQPVDSRSDIFSCGVVLYEILSGRRAFARGSGPETMAATLTEAPQDLSALAPGADPSLCVAVSRCLEKNPENRYQSVKELGAVLESRTTAPNPIAFKVRPRRRGLPALVALVAAVITGGFALYRMAAPTSRPVSRDVTSDGRSRGVDLSPDGQTISYIRSEGSTSQLMVRDLDGGPAVERYLSPGGGLLSPRWSHSGHFIAVATREEILILSRFGGEPARLPIGDGVVRISWSADDRDLVISSANRWFWVASIASRITRRVAIGGPFSNSTVAFLVSDVSPGGDRLLLVTKSEADDRIWSMSTEGDDLRELVREEGGLMDARWGFDSRSIYYLVSSPGPDEIRRARVFPDRPDPSPVVVQGELSAAAFFSTSRTGSLAYTQVVSAADIWRADVSPDLSDRAALPLVRITRGGSNLGPRLSPDGRRIVFTRPDGELGQVLVASSEGDAERILVSRRGDAFRGVWSPDGRRVAYELKEPAGVSLRVVDVQTGRDTAVAPVTEVAQLAWAPGRRIAHVVAGGQNFRLLDPDSGESEILFKDDDEAWSHYPYYSSGGDRMAIFYGRSKQGLAGLATVSLKDRAIRIIADASGSDYRPIGWSADDAYVYAVDYVTQTLVAARSDASGVRTMGAVPRIASGHAVVADGRLKLVFSISDNRSDIKVIDNFDGAERQASLGLRPKSP